MGDTGERPSYTDLPTRFREPAIYGQSAAR